MRYLKYIPIPLFMILINPMFAEAAQKATYNNVKDTIMFMIKLGIVGTVAGYILQAIGKGQMAKFINIVTVLSCITLIGGELKTIISGLWAL